MTKNSFQCWNPWQCSIVSLKQGERGDILFLYSFVAMTYNVCFQEVEYIYGPLDCITYLSKAKMANLLHHSPLRKINIWTFSKSLSSVSLGMLACKHWSFVIALFVSYTQVHLVSFVYFWTTLNFYVQRADYLSTIVNDCFFNLFILFKWFIYIVKCMWRAGSYSFKWPIISWCF